MLLPLADSIKFFFLARAGSRNPSRLAQACGSRAQGVTGDASDQASFPGGGECERSPCVSVSGLTLCISLLQSGGGRGGFDEYEDADPVYQLDNPLGMHAHINRMFRVW